MTCVIGGRDGRGSPGARLFRPEKLTFNGSGFTFSCAVCPADGHSIKYTDQFTIYSPQESTFREDDLRHGRRPAGYEQPDGSGAPWRSLRAGGGEDVLVIQLQRYRTCMGLLGDSDAFRAHVRTQRKRCAMHAPRINDHELQHALLRCR